MSDFEAGAWAAMLADALQSHRHRPGDPRECGAHSAQVSSYQEVEAQVRRWRWISTEAALVTEEGTGLRAGAVADFDGHQPWPPPGMLGALNGLWVLEPDGRLICLA